MLTGPSGDLEAMALYAGEGAARVLSVEHAAARIERIARDAAAALFVATPAEVEQVEVSSPVCYAAEMEEAHRDLADRQEVLSALNELLEAERAGARVLMSLARGAEDPVLMATAHAAWRDEVKWCGVLIRAIQTFHAQPSTRTGEFYEKAVAIENLTMRLEFINRGQGWVAKRLRMLVPRLREGRLQNELIEMLSSHEHNISALQLYLGADGGPRPQGSVGAGPVDPAARI